VPRSVGQVPIYYNHKPTGRPPDPNDHYTSKYLDAPWTPLYPFGYGLSYTTFGYDDLRLSTARLRRSDSLVVSVRVTNTGQRAGDEVVQLYLRDEVASITRPVLALRRFQRLTLAPGEARTVAFTLRAEDLAFPGVNLEPVVEPGFFTVGVGGSSTDLRQIRFELVP
jgi:beta-glucosidase